MSDHYAVIGNPIAHSKSPQIHAAFARQTGERVEYGRILGSLEDFPGDVRAFVADGGRGLNVTVPFKQEAWALLADRSDRAEAAGAVNTVIVLDDGRLRGDNTDGIGLVRDLRDHHGFDFAGKRLLLLGAGGAARGVLPALVDAGPAALTIANRTPTKAVDLAAAAGGEVDGCGFEALAGRRFDLIVNATSSGLGGDVPPLPDALLAADGWVYDMVYGDAPTPFCRWGRARGAGRALDGLGMLVEQAAESFRLWRGVRPQTAPVIAMLRGDGAAAGD
ncbi:MAG: shikimate dehydrogenase [Gammaproteobacteria bacterium]|jgi:shikimate dehydrogenase|nr:shikimate dehydrogenase [Gammaproteobacteria bacterium]